MALLLPDLHYGLFVRFITKALPMDEFFCRLL